MYSNICAPGEVMTHGDRTVIFMPTVFPNSTRLLTSLEMSVPWLNTRTFRKVLAADWEASIMASSGIRALIWVVTQWISVLGLGL